MKDWTHDLGLREQLKTHEGYKTKPYKDTKGILTIGIGRNLEKGLSSLEINYLFNNDIREVQLQLDAAFPWWRKLTYNRQKVMIDMCFNMGIVTMMDFKMTLSAIQDGLFIDAALHMMQSKWAKQVGQRAKTLAKMMEEG